MKDGNYIHFKELRPLRGNKTSPNPTNIVSLLSDNVFECIWVFIARDSELPWNDLGRKGIQISSIRATPSLYCHNFGDV